MKLQLKSKKLRLLFILLCFILPSSILHAATFDAMVVPSLMDSDMDAWYKVPPNSGPVINRAYKVNHGQMFSLLIFFSGYSADKNNNLHIRYDVQVYDPKGNPTEDKGSDIIAYQGLMGNPKALMLNQQYLRIVFTEKYPIGTYNIKVTAYDKVSNKSFISETPIELVSFVLPGKFSSEKEAGEWLMQYYNNPTPIKAISALQQLVQLDSKWLNENLNVLTFFQRVFSDNPFLFTNISKTFDSFTLEDKKKLLLMSAISGDKNLEAVITKNENELKEFYKSAQNIKFPDMSGEINSPTQLDILWSNFLSTGKYQPIKKIVSSLALRKYKGTLDKIKSGEIKNITKEIEQQTYLEATYQSAVWSLISNCKQMPLVFKYCAFIYENENLDEDIKKQLGTILRIAQKKIQEEENKASDKS